MLAAPTKLQSLTRPPTQLQRVRRHIRHSFTPRETLFRFAPHNRSILLDSEARLRRHQGTAHASRDVRRLAGPKTMPSTNAKSENEHERTRFRLPHFLKRKSGRHRRTRTCLWLVRKKMSHRYLKSSAMQHRKKIPRISRGRLAMDCNFLRASCLRSPLFFA